jgi:hypothetical protein
MSSASRATRCAILALVLPALALAAACGAEEIPLPEYTLDASGVANPRTCEQARAGEPSGQNVVFEGEPAQCLGEGVRCSLDGVAAFAGECTLGVPTALCLDKLWRVRCDLLDASTD